MHFNQSNMSEILESERAMVFHAPERFGEFFENANEFCNLIGTGMIKSMGADYVVFAIFFSQIRKHLLLALFSAVRLHKVQAMMNLRQVLEGGTSAAFALANRDPAGFADTRDDGTLDPSQRLAKKRFEWLDKNFPVGSAAFKLMKDGINEVGAHSNIVSAQQTFDADFTAGVFNTPFFDFEDEILVKTDLWQIANIALGVMYLLYGVHQKYGGFEFHESWEANFKKLADKNTELKSLMQNHERFKRFNSQPIKHDGSAPIQT